MILEQDLRKFIENQAQVMDLHASLQNRLSTPINKQQIGVAWSPLPDGYYKVNIDGSHSNLGGSAWGAGT